MMVILLFFIAVGRVLLQLFRKGVPTFWRRHSLDRNRYLAQSIPGQSSTKWQYLGEKECARSRGKIDRMGSVHDEY